MSPSTSDNLATPAWSCRRIFLVGAALVALAAATRLVGLGSLDLWLDEIHTYIASSDLLLNLLHWDTVEQQYHSPLPYILVKVSRTLVGNNAWGMRLPSALHGIAAVAALYLVIGRTINWRTAVWAALLLAVSPVALEQAREARMYSPWLFMATMLIGVAHAAVSSSLQESRHDQDPGRSGFAEKALCLWPHHAKTLALWILVGLLCMLTHASALHGLTTVVAVALWLAIVAAATLFRDHRAAGRILVGAAIAATVFLLSWSLTGIAKLMIYLKPSGPAQPLPQGSATAQLWRAVSEISGAVPPAVAAGLTVLAALGLVLLAKRGHWRIALLILLAALAPLLMFPMAAARMAFYSRYLHVALLAWAVGLGALAAAAWTQTARWPRRIGRTGVILSLLALAALWVPQWHEIFTTPKMRVSAAFAPIVQYGRPGESVFMTPWWASALTAYYPIGPNQIIKRLPGNPRNPRNPRNPGNPGGVDVASPGPPELRTNARGLRPSSSSSPPAHSATDGGSPATGRDSASTPHSAWIFMILTEETPIQEHMEALEPLLAEFGLNDPAHRGELLRAAEGSLTLTARLTPEGIEHLTTTRGRQVH